MNTPALAALAAAALLTLSSCGGSAEPVEKVSAEPTHSVSLPPGDPGLDVPGEPDPFDYDEVTDDHDHDGDGKPDHAAEDHDDHESHGPDDGHDHGLDEPPTVTIPDAAMVSTRDLRDFTGMRWSEKPVPALIACAAAPAPLAAASKSWREPGKGALIQYVTTHSEADARTAVRTIAADLKACGAKTVKTMRLGEESVNATLDQVRVSAVAVEGVVVVMTGVGKIIGEPRWASVFDLAMGTSCAASTHDCH